MSPADYVLLHLLFLSQLVLCSGQDSSQRDNCSFDCGSLRSIGYPFFRNEHRSCGGLIAMECNASVPKARFLDKGKWYPVKHFKYLLGRMEIHDEDLQSHLESNRCDLLGNFSEQAYLSSFNEEWPPHFLSFNITKTRPFFKCKQKSNSPSTLYNQFLRYNCTGYDLYYKNQDENLPHVPANLFGSCSVVQLPAARVPQFDTTGVRDQLTLHWGANFAIEWKVLQACVDCLSK